ncbi:MAG: acylphosphatase [Thermoplasmata archaeon]|nr:acylphosphatase [Thermoplasmata archaeon]
MSGDVVRIHVWFSGRVQGVWFRKHTCDKARSLGVSGWVRNLPDGRVEAVFEGPRDLVEEVLEYCRSGQPYARVEGVGKVEESPRGEKGFEIRY